MIRVPEGSFVSDVIRECAVLFLFDGKQLPAGNLSLASAEGIPLDNRHPVDDIIPKEEPAPHIDHGASTTSQPPLFVVQAVPKHDFRHYYESHHPGLVNALPYLLNNAYRSRHDELWNVLQLRARYAQGGALSEKGASHHTLLTFDPMDEGGSPVKDRKASSFGVSGGTPAMATPAAHQGLKKNFSESNLSVSVEEKAPLARPPKARHGRTQSSGKESYFSEQSERSTSPKGKQQMQDSVHTGHSSHEVDDIDTSSSSGEVNDIGVSTYDMKRDLHRLTNANVNGTEDIKNLLAAVGAVSMTDDNFVKLSPRIDMDNAQRPYTPREYHEKRKEQKVKKRQSLPAGHPIPHINSGTFNDAGNDKKAQSTAEAPVLAKTHNSDSGASKKESKAERKRAKSNVISDRNDDIRSFLNSSGTHPEGYSAPSSKQNSPSHERLERDSDKKAQTYSSNHDDIKSLLSTNGRPPTSPSPTSHDDGVEIHKIKRRDLEYDGHSESEKEREIRMLLEQSQHNEDPPASCTSYPSHPEPTEPMSTQVETASHPLRPKPEDLRLPLEVLAPPRRVAKPVDLPPMEPSPAVQSPDTVHSMLEKLGAQNANSMSLNTASHFDASSKGCTQTSSSSSAMSTTANTNRSEGGEKNASSGGGIHEMLASMGARRESANDVSAPPAPKSPTKEPETDDLILESPPQPIDRPPISVTSVGSAGSSLPKVPVPPLNFGGLPTVVIELTRTPPMTSTQVDAAKKEPIRVGDVQVPAAAAKKEEQRAPTPPTPEEEKVEEDIPEVPPQPPMGESSDDESESPSIPEDLMGKIPLEIISALSKISGTGTLGTHRLSVKPTKTQQLNELRNLLGDSKQKNGGSIRGH